MRRVLVVLLMVTGCYNPDYGEGKLGCGPNGECPTGLQCANDGKCYTASNLPGGDDAAVPDAPPARVDAHGSDAPVVPPDAARFDAARFDGALADDAAPLDAAAPVDALVTDAFVADAAPGPAVIVDSAPAAFTNKPSQDITFHTVETGTTFLCTFDAMSAMPCSSPYTPPDTSEGPHTLFIVASLGGVPGDPVEIDYTVDVTPPTTSIDSYPSDPIASSSAQFKFSANEPATFLCSRDGNSASSCTSPQQYTNLTDIKHTFFVQAVDRAGNVDTTGASYAWTVDTTPPDTQITAGPTAGSTTGTSFTFSFQSTEGNSTLQCKLDTDASFSSCSTSASYTGVAGGTRTFTVVATDAAGNVDPTPASVTWTVDATPPAVTFDSPTAGSTTGPSGNVTFHSDDASATYACALDQTSTFTSCTTTKPFSGLSNGSHTGYVVATDSHGNTSAPASLTWNVDANPPTISITAGPSENFTTGKTVSFSYQGSEALSALSCTLDGVSQTCAFDASNKGSVTFSISSGGTHTFKIWGTDAYGNVNASAPTQIDWNVDVTPPTTVLTSKPSNPSKASVAFQAASSPIESNLTFVCKLDGVVVTCANGTFSTTISGPDGSHTFFAQATDQYGNQDTTGVTYTWTVDTTPPTITFKTVPSSITNQTFAPFTITTTEGTLTCSLDGGSYLSSNCGNQLLLAYGQHTLAAKATDAAGNTGTGSYTWTVTWVPLVQLPFELGSTQTGANSSVTFAAPASVVPNGVYNRYVQFGSGGNSATTLKNAGSLLSGTSQWTIAFWMMDNSSSTYWDNQFAVGLRIVENTFGQVQFCVTGASLGTKCATVSTSLTGGWHHFIVQQDTSAGGTGNIDIYLDGANAVAASIADAGKDPIMSGASDPTIGSSQITAMDDLRIFDTVFKKASDRCTYILNRYWDGSNCVAPTPVLHYSFDSCDGTNTGSAGQSYNGNLTGGSCTFGRNSVGQAMYFDQIHWLDVPGINAAGSPLVTTSANPSMTVAIWAEAPVPQNGGELWYTLQSGVNGGGMELQPTPGTITFLDWNNVALDAGSTDATFHNYLFRYDAFGQSLDAFVDGANQGSFGNENPFTTSQYPDLLVGQGTNEVVDDVKVFNVSFSDDATQCGQAIGGQYVYSANACITN